MFPQVELSTIQPFFPAWVTGNNLMKSKGMKEIFCRHKQMLHWQVSETEDGSLKHNRWADYFLGIWVPFLWIENFACGLKTSVLSKENKTQTDIFTH